MEKTVLLEKQGNIAFLTFNRPFAANSFNGEMSSDLLAATQALKEDSSIRAVLMRGAGKLFMSGGDIKAMHEGLDQMPGDIPSWAANLHDAIHNLTTLHAPVIAAVHGSVAGAGISIMLAADLVIASHDTIFTLAYSQIAVSPDGGASYHLPRMVGHKKAMELLLLAERFDAHEAQNYGLINRIVPRKEIFIHANSLAKQISEGPTKTYGKIKQLMSQTWQNDLVTQMNKEAELFVESTTTKDFHEGVSAFVGKRLPAYEGK